MSIHGPNVQALIIHKMSLIMIPPGTPNPLTAGLTALSNKDGMVNAVREAEKWVKEAIALVKTCPNNPWPDDEAIAGEIMRGVKERQAAQRRSHYASQSVKEKGK